MRSIRSHADRTRHKLARVFRTHNLSGKTLLQQEEDFNLGLKVETGTLSTVSEIIRAVSILDDLVIAGKITKDHCTDLKMNLAQKMSGFKVVPK